MPNPDETPAEEVLPADELVVVVQLVALPAALAPAVVPPVEPVDPVDEVPEGVVQVVAGVELDEDGVPELAGALEPPPPPE